jgi:flagellar hook-length control protein FliK
MRVESSGKNAVSALNSENTDRSDKADRRAKNKFQSVFGSHHDRKETTKERQSKGRESRKSQDEQQADDQAIDPVNADQNHRQSFRPIEIEHVEAPRPIAPAAIVEGLVREITLVTSDERQDIHIQFDSRTLEGLQIQISKEHGNVSLQFVTSSVEVERILHRNMDQLTNSLSQRGVNLSSNRIERVTRRVDRQQGSRPRSGG